MNRKGFFSINCQPTCSANMMITNVVARWSGGTHDSRIFKEFRLNDNFVSRQAQWVLIVDVGYDCLPYMMTSIARPAYENEEHYNGAHMYTHAKCYCGDVWIKAYQAPLYMSSFWFKTKNEHQPHFHCSMLCLDNIAGKCRGDKVENSHRRLQRPGESPQDGEMNEMTQPSKDRIRNSSPGSLRSITLPLCQGGSPQYLIFTSERGKTFCFFETWRPEWGSNPRFPTFQAGSFNHCTRAPAPR